MTYFHEIRFYIAYPIFTKATGSSSRVSCGPVKKVLFFQLFPKWKQLE